MKSATVKEIKEELSSHSKQELVQLCLDLAKFKKENKELLTYLLYESVNEEVFAAGVIKEMDEQFALVNQTSQYLAKKNIRRILRLTLKYIRYSRKKETDIALRIHFCTKLKQFGNLIEVSTTMKNLYNRELTYLKKAVATLHEDLQYDYVQTLELLEQK